MRMMKLAYINFKNSFKNYLSLVISLAFTILIFLNFQNVLYSDALAVLGEWNKSNTDILIKVVSFVLGCFMFFFIWYSTNVFLTKRKKDIGIYIFMGLSNEKIGKMYMIEILLTGLSALCLGVAAGILTTGLFQMILLAISDIAVEISFHFTIQPILWTVGVYGVIYFIFAVKGYLNIVRSSVLDLVSATRQNEYVRQNVFLLSIKTILGLGVLGSGYYMAIKASAQMIDNIFGAVILVTVGVYLLFGGLLPMIFQGLAGNKKFLYYRQRCLWINNVIFRMKKNYRTYAMVCVLTLCSVTALATGFAMKYRYDNIMKFENTYTFQLLSNQTDLGGRAEELLKEETGISYSSECPILQIDNSLFGLPDGYSAHGVIAYSDLKRLAEDAGLEFMLEEPTENETIAAGHLYLLSTITANLHQEVFINGKSYHEIEETTVPYLGYLQEKMSFYIVNDAEYEKLLPFGQELYTYNYRIDNTEEFYAARERLDVLISNTEENFTARCAIDPNSNDSDWIKVLYSLCIFMFMVFILASGSIMFMKLYNDAFEEKERYLIMRKMGFDDKALKKSIAKELGTAYVLPFLVMSISSYFSVHALEKMMKTNLRSINVVSVLVVLAIFAICYRLSVKVYQKNSAVS